MAYFGHKSDQRPVRVDFKEPGGSTHITSAFAKVLPLTSQYKGLEVPQAEIKVTFIVIGRGDLKDKVDLADEAHFGSKVLIVTGLKQFSGHYEVVGRLQGSVATSSSESGIISHWSFGDSNDLGNDTQGLNPLTEVNTPSYSSESHANASPQDGSVDLERGNNERLEITDGSQQSLDITGDITILFRFKPESIPSASNLVTKSDGGGGSDRAYEIWMDSSGKIRGSLSSDGSNSTSAIGATSLSTGTWYTIGVVYNGTDIRVYIDGSLDSNGSNNPKTYSSGIYNSGQKFVIGARSDAVNHTDGLIDDCRIYNEAKSASEVSDWHSNGST
jgi:hypothetical protein